MERPILITLEYPPQHGGVAKYLEGEVRASSVPVMVKVVDETKWLSLVWRVRPPSWLWISHVLPIGYAALVWKWIYKTRYRVYLHGLDLVLPLKSWWKKFWVKTILQNADEIIVNSHATKKLLNNYGFRRDAIHRVSVRYPKIEKIDTTQYIAKGKELRKKYQIGNKPILLTISRLVKRKGIDLVIRSLPAVWREIPDLVYVVVGEGDYRDHLLETRHCLVSTEKQNQIIFVGFVSEEEKYGWLAACDCFILTPIDDPNDFEGYGIVYKEAQMFGKPVIGSRVGGVPEAVGEDGALIASNDVSAISDAIVDIFRNFQ